MNLRRLLPLRYRNEQSLQADVLIGLGFLGILLSVVLAVSHGSSQFPWNVAGGSGAPDDPYMIATCEQLQTISLAPDKAYVLTHDIDCSETAEWDSGAGFFPVGYYGYGFSGSFDGRGYTIHDLTIRRPSSDYIGLFGKLDLGARVKNVSLEVDIAGHTHVGGIVGWMVGGTIEDVQVKGSIRGNSSIGGIAGVNQGTIIGAVNGADVRAIDRWVGGIVGWNYVASSVRKSYAVGHISGTSFVGGIAGVSHGASIEGCIAGTEVSGREVVGGIVGHLVGYDSVVSSLRDCRFVGTVNTTTSESLVGSKNSSVLVDDVTQKNRR